MDHSAEASMEEILASIRRIIATEPKAVKALADEHFQKFSGSVQQPPLQSFGKDASSFGSDISKKQPSQDQAVKVDPSFSSLSTSSPDSKKILSNVAKKPTAQSFAEALDLDLAGLIETPQSPPEKSQKDLLEKSASTEKRSQNQSFSHFSEVPSKSSIQSQNLNSDVKEAENQNPFMSSADVDTFKPDPPFYSNLTSNDFLSKETLSSSSHTPSPEFAVSPKDLLGKELYPPTSFSDETPSQSLSAITQTVVETEQPSQALRKAEEFSPKETFINSTFDSFTKETANSANATDFSSGFLAAEMEKPIDVNASPHGSQRTFEDVVCEMLRPMLQSWVENNLPHLIPKLLKIDNS